MSSKKSTQNKSKALSSSLDEVTDVQAKCYSCVIRETSDIANYKRCRSFISKLSRVWGEKFTASITIIHDNDIDDDTGEKQPCHIHFVAWANRRTRKSSVINWIADICGCSTLSVFVRATKSRNASIRYLLHLDDNDKFQYSPDDLSLFGSESKSSLDLALRGVDELTADELIELLERFEFNPFKILRYLGIHSYMSYRNIITDLIRFKKETNYESRENSLREP